MPKCKSYFELVVYDHVEFSDVWAGVYHEVDVVCQLLLLGVVVADGV